MSEYQMEEEKYCKCDIIPGITSEADDLFEYDICIGCLKVIKGTQRWLDHYDGEDHVEYDVR